MLGALLMPLAVAEFPADAMGHAAENIEGRGRPFGIEKIPRPRRHLAVGIAILRRDELDEVGEFLVIVEKRIEVGAVVRGQRELLGGIVLDGRGRGERQGLGALVEGRDRHTVAEHVVDPAQRHRLRHDLETAGKHAQIVAVARAQHDAMFAERHRARIAIFGLVMNRQQGHRRRDHRDFVRSNLYRSLLNPKSVCCFDRQQLRKMVLDSEGDTSLLLGTLDVPPVMEENATGRSPFLLTADHYGRLIPRILGDLGVPVGELTRHIAWDIGIAGVAEALSDHLDAHLIAQRYSRLVIDCNRPPGAPSSIPLISEATTIAGNEGLERDAAEVRRQAIFNPYHRRIKEVIDRRLREGMPTVLVSLHSFTPAYAGVARPWHIGTLYHRDTKLPPLLLRLLRAESDLVVGDNEPYAVSDETDYTIPVHGEARGLMNSGIEIRQDLIADPAGQRQWADRLARIFGEIETTLRAQRLLPG